VALEALLAERNVGRAGRRIGLSQSAMSAALARLRVVFRDPLLVRAGRNLALTHGAEELITPIREILGRIEQTISERPQFNPRTDARSFSISASDYATLVCLCLLCADSWSKRLTSRFISCPGSETPPTYKR